MEARSRRTSAGRTEARLGLALCAAVAAAAVIEQLGPRPPAFTPAFAPAGLPLAAAALAAAALVRWTGPARWLRLQRALLWSGLLLMVWAANGLPLDILRVVGLIPLPVDWAGLATKTFALAAAIVLAHLALARPAAPGARHPPSWYGYAAFVLALPYPALRLWWALGGTPGISRPGAAGEGFAPLLLALPWLLAAAVSLLLVQPRRGVPRRLMLVAGWTGTTIVAMIGPAAVWTLLAAWLGGGVVRYGDIAPWVFALFYGSWFLWAIAAGAATRSYQLRSDVPAEQGRQATIEAEFSGR